ncbi:hypothetical protein BMF94_5664 [Rhodotorula taiwanensis]|uniref:mRNA export factor MEX67 n=1 Tax=Rhodotorula taiwanensis TaxID=741276 RepID=A0A2S5B3I7_9BASI|nr:hypothetical protein BMF94_5664 [Rhodotorula taiwanensis]
MPPSAAAALLAAALPKGDAMNGSAGTSTGRGGARRGGLGRTRGAGASHMEEDVGMSDGNEANSKRRGRQGRAGPMGDRHGRLSRSSPVVSCKRYSTHARARRPPWVAGPSPSEPRRGGRNAPGVISDKSSKPAAGSSKGSKASEPTKQSTIDTLRLFLLSRYSQPDRLLNLENMAEDPILKEHKLIPPGQPGAPSNMAGAMWKLAREMFPDVISLSFANNNLTSTLPLSPYLLTSSLSDIENVSFAGNNFSQFRDMDPFSPDVGKKRNDKKPKGWSKLRELVLTGNPVVHSGGGSTTYEREMARRFATLRTLDQKPLDPSIAFAVGQDRANGVVDSPGLSARVKSEKAKAAKREAITFPLPISGGFFESEGARDFVGSFFIKFFEAFDNDRPALLPAYAPICTFSFHADTAHPARARAKKVGSHGDKRLPHQHKLDWKPYLTAEGSRNLMRVKNPEKRVKTLQVTPAAVIASVAQLPKTKHPLDDSAKFIWDSWTMPNFLAPPAPGTEGETVIFASVHGEFSEVSCKGVRSFDRNFILAPAPPGSPAQAAGWPCIVLSDILTVRGYSDLTFSKPRAPRPQAAPTGQAATAAPASATTATAGAVPERAEGITDEQQSLVLQLQQVTSLNYQFAHMCLAQNGWDPHQALAQFQTLHAQGAIPPEAFAQPPPVA